MAAISRLEVQLLHFTPPALKSTSLFSRFRRFTRSTPCKFFTPRLLCSVSDSTPQSSSREAGLSSSIVCDLLDYLNESWTQFHATAEAKRQLVAAGFHLLNKDEEWDLMPGGCDIFYMKYVLLVAFSIGENIREICGKEDVDTAYKYFKAIYETSSSIDRKLKVDV